jgi:[acyl-carrier-protein] S-malonyltransferase
VLVLIFSGQGSQRPGMGAAWLDHPSWPIVGQLSEFAGRDIAKLLIDTDSDELRATRNAQLATYALSLIALDAVKRGPLLHLDHEALPGRDGVSDGIAAVAGHSLGEYTALVAAGALEAGAGAALVQARGEAMQVAAEANPGTMAAVLGLDLAGVAEVCAEAAGAWVANDNTPGQVVVAGTLNGVEQAGAAALRLGAKRVVPLQVGGAFHTPLMQPAQEPLDAVLAGVAFAPSSPTVIANVDASAHTDGFARLLSAQLCSRVRWRESLLAMAGMGATLFLELGPGTELSGMVKRTVPEATRANVASPEDLEGLRRLLEA